MTKIGFGKISVLAFLAVGAMVLSASEGCSVSLENNTCASSGSGTCPTGDTYYTGCSGSQTPIVFGNSTCSATGTTAGDFCCTPDTTGGGDSGKPDSSSGDAGSGLNACNECLYQGCSGYWAVCQQDTSCVSIYHCATAPSCVTDQTCVTACYNAGTTAGQKAYLGLSTCDNAGLCGTCKATCGTADSTCAIPDGGSAPDTGVVDNCQTCVTSLCATEKAACGAGSDCDDYTNCLTACSDAPCIDACGLAHATGKTASQALGDCTSKNCASNCGL